MDKMMDMLMASEGLEVPREWLIFTARDRWGTFFDLFTVNSFLRNSVFKKIRPRLTLFMVINTEIYVYCRKGITLKASKGKERIKKRYKGNDNDDILAR